MGNCQKVTRPGGAQNTSLESYTPPPSTCSTIFLSSYLKIKASDSLFEFNKTAVTFLKG